MRVSAHLLVGITSAFFLIAQLDAQLRIRQGPNVAPVSVRQIKMGYEVRIIGPAGWACTNFNYSSSYRHYDTLLGYLHGDNDAKVNLLADDTTWPVVEKTGAVNELCVYLPKQYQCYPPKPNSSAVVTKNERQLKPYFGRSFWGQASSKRVSFEVKMLKNMMKMAGVKPGTVDYNTLYLSSFQCHVHEVRFDYKPPALTPAKPNATAGNQQNAFRDYIKQTTKKPIGP